MIGEALYSGGEIHVKAETADSISLNATATLLTE